MYKDETKPINIHGKCYCLYSDERAAVVASRRKSTDMESIEHNSEDNDNPVQPGPSSHADSAVPNFNCKICFICQASVEKDHKKKGDRKKSVYTVVGRASVQERLTTILSNREDPSSLRIMSRIKDVDLVKVRARYHLKCIVSLQRRNTESHESIGRSTMPVDIAMEYIYSYLDENSDSCQFTVAHLAEQIPENCRPHEKTVNERLLAKYGDEILVYELRGAGTIVCFKDTGRQLLSEVWYSSRAKDEITERHRVMREAGAIVREEIRSKLYPIDHYPATSCFLEGAEEDVPESLSIFLEEVILPSKRKSSIPSWKKTVTSIAHAIIKAARPRCFISKVLLGVGCFLNKKFASRLLVDTLSAIGFSCSYSEVELLELSCISRNQPEVLPSGFSQWVADNSDYNVHTLDGRGSWHVMAIIQSVTPSTSIQREEAVSRHVKERRSINAADLGKIELVPYETPSSVGLKTIHVLNLDQIYSFSKQTLPSLHDLLWLYGKWTCDVTVPGWNGFMEQIREGLPFETSKILYLPFINSPPTDNTIVNTTLLHACQVGNASGQKTKFITFDQQLYWKARDIVPTAREDSELKNVVVRLGGFHLMMSFMGAIGNIMSGSGLENLWGEIYAGGSITQMLLGKAYARAVRAHILSNLSLAKIVLDSLDQDDSTFGMTRDFLDNVIGDIDRTHVLDVIHEDSCAHFSRLFTKKLEEFEQRGPTAKLWVQYFRMTSFLKQFLEAERTGNWNLHLATIRRMLPFFHSTGHFNYAKSAHLYLQDMTLLEKKMTPQEFHKFTDLGYFTLRRSNKYFAGIFPDQTIEQTIIRSAKSREGVKVHGRGITENVTAKWTMGMFSLINVCEQFETFCDVYCESSEQHVDMRSSRIKRDNEDAEKLDTWFASHYPFPNVPDIVSIGTGIVGDTSINCHRAEEDGNRMMSNMYNDTFGFLKFKRSEAVKPLSNMTVSIKVKNIFVSIDPLLLFQRIVVSQPTTKELEGYLHYELSPYPMSLFDEGGMRKGSKSTFYDAFCPLTSDIYIGENRFFVLDGGYLLHKVKWDNTRTIQDICGKYIAYLQRHYPNSSAAVIFDGYSSAFNDAGTKSLERQRRSSKYASPSIEFERSTSITVSQENFLSNDSNKDSFIGFLRMELEAVGFEVRQAFEDADCLIVKTALKRSAEYDSATIIGEDIDLLVLLAALGSPEGKTYLKKPSHGKTPERIYSPQSFKNDALRPHVPFLHAFSGCDTTSAPYSQGKLKLISLLNNSENLRTAAQHFQTPFNSKEAIEGAGQTIFKALYGGLSCKDTLAILRFKKFNQSATKTKANLCSLPPSPAAANLHSQRVYFQVQAWLGNYMDPLEWGWKKAARGLEPVMTTRDPAPESLMKLVTCGCKMNDCGAACGCRKSGLLCSAACKHCGGEDCSNVPAVDTEENFLEENDMEVPSLVVRWPSTSTSQKDDNSKDSEAESTATTEEKAT